MSKNFSYATSALTLITLLCACMLDKESCCVGIMGLHKTTHLSLPFMWVVRLKCWLEVTSVCACTSVNTRSCVPKLVSRPSVFIVSLETGLQPEINICFDYLLIPNVPVCGGTLVRVCWYANNQLYHNKLDICWYNTVFSVVVCVQCLLCSV